MSNRTIERFAFGRMLISWLLVCAAAVLLGGCATRQQARVGDPPTLADQAADTPALLVTIEYPVAVDPSAYPAFRGIWKRSNMRTGHLLGTYRSRYAVEPAVDGMINEQLAKSAFHALTLYRRLTQLLPADRVSLQPREITVDDSGRLAYKRSGPQIPSALLVDFSVSTALYRAVEGRLWYPDTFGTQFGPRAVIFQGVGAGGVEERLLAGWGAPYQDAQGTASSPSYLDVLQWPEERSLVPGYSESASTRPAQKGRYFSFGFLAYSLAAEEAAAWAAAEGSGADPFRDPIDLFAYVVVDLLNEHPELVRQATLAYAEAYDPALAATLGHSGQVTAPHQAYDTFRKCAEVERKMLHAQDTEFAAALRDGEFGSSMRAMLAAELDFERRATALQNQYTAAALAGTVASVTSSVYVAEGLISPQQNLTIQMQLLRSSAERHEAQGDSLHDLASLFARQLSRTLAAQNEYTVAIAGADQKINAQTFADLRTKLQRVYALAAGPVAAQ